MISSLTFCSGGFGTGGISMCGVGNGTLPPSLKAYKRLGPRLDSGVAIVRARSKEARTGTPADGSNHVLFAIRGKRNRDGINLRTWSGGTKVFSRSQQRRPQMAGRGQPDVERLRVDRWRSALARPARWSVEAADQPSESAYAGTVFSGFAYGGLCGLRC